MTTPTRPPVSVCLATHNGSQYIRAQLDSILTDLLPSDELIVVDDASTDATYELVEQFGAHLAPGQLKLHRSATNDGHTATFAKAIQFAGNPLIALSDQDDLWPPGRLNALAHGLLTHNVALVFGSLQTFGDEEGGVLLNRATKLQGMVGLVRRVLPHDHYAFGSACAFRREAIRSDVPITTESHENWLIAQALAGSGVAFTESVVTHRRLHSSNLTQRRPFLKRLRSRTAEAIAMARIMHRASQ